MSATDSTAGHGRATLPSIATVYAAGFVQGLTLVSFPALSTVLKQVHGFTDAQYGAIFLPQVAMAVVGAVAGGSLAKKLGLETLLWIALLVNGLSQALLAGSAFLDPGLAYPGVLLGTAALGLGLGLSGAPLNSYPPRFFPGKDHAAVVALHTILGLGLAAGPLLANTFAGAGAWVGFPLLLLGLCLALTFMALIVSLPGQGDVQAAESADSAAKPLGARVFWIFVAVAVLYAFAEGTFANWAVIYLSEVKELPESTAGLALSVFWVAMVAGRLLVSALVVRVSATPIWLALPALMIAAFLLLPYANTAFLGIALFTLAGLACSAFFPLTITLVSKEYPAHVAWVSSMMIAALMVGVGLGSFVIGPLRELFSLENLYRLSAVYPLLVLALGSYAVWLGACRKPPKEMEADARVV